MAEDKRTTYPSIPSLIDGLDFGVVLIDQDLKLLWTNNAMERLFGLTRSAIQGYDVFSFMNTHIISRIAGGEAFRDSVFSSIAAGTPVPPSEFQISSPTGHMVWIEYSSQVIEHGPFQGMRLDIYQDITLRKMLTRELDRHVGQLGILIEGKNADLTRAHEQLKQEYDERMRVEEQLVKEQEFSANLLKSSPAFLLALDSEGMVLMASDSMLRSMECEKSALVGKNLLTEFILAEDRERVSSALREIVTSHAPAVEEYRLRTSQGSILLVEWHHRPVYRSDGALDYVLGVGIDITARKAIEEALIISEDLYRTTFENTLAATAIINADTSIFRVNAEFERVFGYTTTSLQGKKLVNLVPPNERGRLATLLLMVREGGAPSSSQNSCECQVTGSDGRLHDTLIAVASISGSDRSIASLLDITERKRAETVLADHNRYLYTMNQMITAATSTATLHESLGTLLEKSIKLLEYDAGAIYLVDSERKTARLKSQRGIPEWLISTAQEIDVLTEPYRRVFSDGIPVYLEKKQIGLFSMAWIPFIASDRVIGAVYFVSGHHDSFSDSHRVILESFSREVGNVINCGLLKEDLEESNQLANLYLDIMTHDINNANAVSLMYAELLVEMLEGEQKELTRKLSAGVRRSTDIILNVSTMRKIREEKITLRPIRLDDVIRSEIEVLPAAHIAFDPSGYGVCADPLLSEVFANLLGNSIKFGGEKVQITVSVVDVGEEIEVTVADTGPGIPDSVKPVLFRKFERGVTKVRGKGLGLYLSRMLVERYGGRIWVEDRVLGHADQGVAIKFRLRKAPQPSRSSPGS